MIRIGFTLIGGNSWTGGYNYLLNLLRVITQCRAGELQPVLFFGTDVGPEDERPFRSINTVEIVTSPLMNRSRRTTALFKSLVLGADPAIRHMFNENRIDVVFENAQFHGAKLGIPAIAWIPDFQHRELPHLFSRGAWWKRELGFRAQITADRTIMLSSMDARGTCERHYPATIGRTHVVRFAVPVVNGPDAATVHAARKAHDLPERYFYLPNQFWQHKNHLLVIEALALLKRRGYSLVIAASGRQLDPYKPQYFNQVVSRIESLGVADQFRLLGLIPYEHIAPLMVGSVAVLNPSLFEGWSTTVEEARALHVPLVLSDIAVHKEQAPYIARFFDRNSADSLASALLDVWQSGNISRTVNYSATSTSDDPVQKFADNFVDLVKVVANQKHRELEGCS